MADDTATPSKRVIDALPTRPLTLGEGDALEGATDGSVQVRAESLMLLKGDRVVVALAIYQSTSERLWGVGYSPVSGGWEVFGSWESLALGHDDFYDALYEWEQRTYHARTGG